MRWLVLLLLLSLPGLARAEAFPWVPVDGDVRLVADPRMDLELRLYMIRQARTSIDVVIYEQGDDLTVGLPVLSALRDAANRGVKVRLVTDWFFQYLTHPFNESPTFTTNPPTAVPIEYVVFGSPESVMRNGWEPSDGVHGKLLTVDHNWSLTTGRSHAEGTLKWIDASVLMKGALVAQSEAAFNALWEATKIAGEIVTPTFQRDAPSEIQQKQYLPPSHTRLNAAEQVQFRNITAWLGRASLKAPPGQEKSRGRLLHFDFVRQMTALNVKKQTPKNWDERMERLVDPVSLAIIERLKAAGQGTHIRFTAMYAILHPALKAAVLEARGRGAEVDMFTNHQLVAPPITTMAWLAGIQDTAEFVTAGVRVHAFRRNPRNPWTFMHLKVMVVDDTVFYGSHNFNLPSSVANDELHYQVVDTELAAQAAALFDGYVSANSELITAESAASEKPLGPLARWILTPLMGFY